MTRPPEPRPPARSGRDTITAATLLCVLLSPSISWAQGVERRPDYRPAAFAITGATIVASPDRTIEEGTVVLRDGLIEAVGPTSEIEVPYDAERIEGEGLVLYSGFIDLYTTIGQDENVPRSATGLSRPIPLREFAQASTPPDNRNGLTPEFRVASALKLDESTVQTRRKLGFTTLLSAPSGAIATGQSALVSLSGFGRRESIVSESVALHLNLASPRGREYGLFDVFGIRHDEHCAGHTHSPQDEVLIHLIEEAMAAAGPPDSGGYPGALMGVIAHLRQAMLDADYHHKLLEYAREKGGPLPPFDPGLEALHASRTGALPAWWQADSRDAIHRVLDLAEEFGTGAVLVGGRDASKVLDRLNATKTPVVLRVDFPKEPEVPSEAEYREKPLAERDPPLRELQQSKARWDERVELAGTLAEAGIPFAFSSNGLNRVEDFHAKVRQAIDAGLDEAAAIKALTIDAAQIAGVSDRLGTLEPGKLGHLVAWDGSYGSKDAKLRYLFVDGAKFEMDAGNGPRPSSRNAQDRPDRSDDDSTKDSTESTSEGDSSEEPDEAEVPFVDVATEFDEDRVPSLSTGGNVLIKDVTILTVSNGTIPKGSILIKDGKIAEIGQSIEAPEGLTVVDAKGMVAFPGIIDTHSHMAIEGGLNESSLSINPEVRVKDVVTSDDVTIYQGAAGGVTAARLLHGSANTIGGQDAVIKLVYGKAARDLIVRDGPQGVKFALGENVTQKRESRPARFPYTRPGVEAVLVRAFEEARDYQARRRAFADAIASGEDVSPFRRDLRLEALANILDGSIKIHSHCYRADEILMLLRVAERYGMKVQSLQHVLEGYKVAAEIAAHGASNSTFSDWYAYKVEAYDAIPHNAALLTEAGAAVCIKSDSGEEVRHLSVEAAKMVRYGGVTEDQALAMITLNPARELGLDHRLGSIEVGKDADIALFNAHPLDGFAQCQLTLIDGEVAFQRYHGKDGPILRPRPGNHEQMPQSSEAVRSQQVEIVANPDGMYALINATIHPVTGPTIEGGTIIIKGDTIAEVGGAETAVPEGASTINLAGLDVWPGMIDSGSDLGLNEIGSISATQDAQELAPYQPELRASVAINADSALIAANRIAGVLSSFVRPTGGTISGQGALIDLNGWVWSEMVQHDELALYVNVPPAPPANLEDVLSRVSADFANRYRERFRDREKRLNEFKQLFRSATRFDEIRRTALERGEFPPVDPRLEALVPYARGEKPVVFAANGRGEILSALDLSDELNLKAIISGGADAWKVAGRIKESGVPVLITGTHRNPGRNDPYDAAYANPAWLVEAGVTVAITSTGDASEVRNLPMEAAMAVAYGLSEEDAVKAVTLVPAKIFGVDDQLGSIEPGKRANLIISAGHLLQPTSEVKHLIIRGRPVAPESRQTELYERYRRRLSEIRDGSSPIGLVRDSATPAMKVGEMNRQADEPPSTDSEADSR
ncbi:amidohydrolase family protein [Tautonia rosea]|uniref:amidohydrolase family protein n=1 Tax=Tautonia rosea TaxID=2728037 RepID=UPI001473D231|nr:amidohydrolase family protein [Tautonia rosea]